MKKETKIATIEGLLTQIDTIINNTDCEAMKEDQNPEKPEKNAAIVLSASGTKCRTMCCGNVMSQAQLIAHVIKQNPILEIMLLHVMSE